MTIAYGVTFANVVAVVCTSAFALGAPLIIDVTSRGTTSFAVKVRSNTAANVSGAFALSWIATGVLAT